MFKTALIGSKTNLVKSGWWLTSQPAVGCATAFEHTILIRLYNFQMLGYQRSNIEGDPIFSSWGIMIRIGVRG
jgi:hypothetical protein